MHKFKIETAEKILREFYGYREFRQGQAEIISSILDGKNVLAILPTGGGKSLCYQIPALISEKLSIVISPLIALMKDQVDSINRKKEVAAFVNSSMSFDEANTVLNKLSAGKIKLLFLSPEKITNKEFADRIKNLNVEYLFIDEAHCISQWGHNFRPSYLKIREFIDYIGVEKASAFTATATKKVREDIVDNLNLSNPKIFVKGFFRENLQLNAIKTSHKKEKVLELIKTHEKPAIIYGATRKGVEELVDYLRSNKINAEYYHAGLSPELRRIIQDDFINDRVKIIAATNAFGMGIDKPNIRLVIHYNLTGTIENYYQEIGRAGRDGKDASVYLLFDDRDRHIQEFFISNSYPDRDQIELIYNAICDHGRVTLGNLNDRPIEFDRKFSSFLRTNKISGAILDSAVKVLEEAGYLKSISDFDKSSTFRFIISPNELKKFVKRLSNSSLKDTLLYLLREYGSLIFSKEIKIDLQKLAEKIGTDTGNLENDLQRAELFGFANYTRDSHFQSVQLSQTRVAAKALNVDTKNIEEKLRSAEDKLEAMINFAESDVCRYNIILNYFGEETDSFRCGICDNCRGTAKSPSASDYLSELIIKTVHISENKISENSLTAILLGKSKDQELKRFSTFGACVHFNQNDLTQIIETLVSKKYLRRFENNLVLEEAGKDFIAEHEELINEKKPSEIDDSLVLFNKLRGERKSAAKKFSQNPDMICSDEILKKIAEVKPISAASLFSIEGFTQRIFNKFGDEILSTVKDFLSAQKIGSTNNKTKIPDEVVNTMNLIKKGYSLKDIITLSKLPETVVSMQIETIIGFNQELDFSKLIDAEHVENIRTKIDEGFLGLKELKSNLPSDISYAEIRIVSALNKINLKNRF